MATALRGDPPASATTTPDVRLYFDGGSRGNPGVTGTGSVIVTRTSPTADWRIDWCDAHYLGDHITNNVAEHTALMRGLQECRARYGAEHQLVIIVGDSQLILNQISGKATTHQHDLHTLVQRSQAHLRHLHSYQLEHTLRRGNKMADCLANWAMDNRRTYTLAPTDAALQH